MPRGGRGAGSPFCRPTGKLRSAGSSGNRAAFFGYFLFDCMDATTRGGYGQSSCRGGAKDKSAGSGFGDNPKGKNQGWVFAEYLAFGCEYPIKKISVAIVTQHYLFQTAEIVCITSAKNLKPLPNLCLPNLASFKNLPDFYFGIFKLILPLASSPLQFKHKS